MIEKKHIYRYLFFIEEKYDSNTSNRNDEKTTKNKHCVSTYFRHMVTHSTKWSTATVLVRC